MANRSTLHEDNRLLTVPANGRRSLPVHVACVGAFEDVLADMFEQICGVVDSGTGIVRSGEYTLTRLAAAVVEVLNITRQSLTLLTGTLRAQLAQSLGVLSH